MSVHAQPMPEGLAPAPGNADTAANTSGRDVARPERGFGQLWEKRFTASLGATRSPEEVMRIWKEHLAELWPAHSSFYAPFRGIEEGEVAGLDIGIGPAQLSTGVLVAESTPTSFTLQAPEGHMLAGHNRFSTRLRDGRTEAQIRVFFRSNDPLYELGLMLGGHKAEELFWTKMMENLGKAIGEPALVQVRRRRLDRRRKWRNAGNIRKNAAIRTVARRTGRVLLLPFRTLGRSR